jgi:ribonuclease R
MEAEREAVAMYRAYLVRDQIGERFTGAVSAVTSFGAFVELDQPFVEGLIKLESLGTTSATTRPGCACGRAARASRWRWATRSTVELVDVSVARRRIELRLAAGGSAATTDDAGPPSRRRTRETAPPRGRETAPPPRGREELPAPAAPTRFEQARRQRAGRAVAKANPKAGKRKVSSARPSLGVSHHKPRKK